MNPEFTEPPPFLNFIDGDGHVPPRPPDPPVGNHYGINEGGDVNEQERIRKLADHLRPMGYSKGSWSISDVASGILADPQGHVDALVAAGVLEAWPGTIGGSTPFTVVQPQPPHVHDWRVDHMRPAGTLLVRCTGCPERRVVSAQLPIEVPT